MYKKFIILVVVAFGLATFFLPLVRIQAPFVGTQKISGWDVVKPKQEKQQRTDFGLGETLDKLRAGVFREKRQEPPLAVKQAQALAVTLPLAYLALLLGGVLVMLERPAPTKSGSRPLQIAAAVGLLASVYSLLSVYWLSGGVREIVAAGRGSRVPLIGALRKSIAEKVDVTPETGLYLLVAALAALLLASFLPAGSARRG